jgi:DNA-binding transcriptional LysR family regulator
MSYCPAGRHEFIWSVCRMEASMANKAEDVSAGSSTPAAVKMRQLELMVAIEKAGNLRKAALLMGLTQPAASRILQEMELALRVQLFERSHEGLTPTVYGSEVLLRARAVISDVAAISETVAALQGGEAGILKLGTTGSFAPTVLAAAIAEVKRHSAKLRIEITEADNETLLHDLRAGVLNLVVGRTLSGQLTDNLWRELVYEERFQIVCSTRHPLATGSLLEVKELVQWPWIVPPVSTPLRHMLETQIALAGAMPPTNLLVSGSAMTNLALLNQMPCFSVMSNSLASYLAAEGLLQMVSCDITLTSGAGCAYFRRREDSVTGPAAHLLNTMRTAVASAQPPDMFATWSQAHASGR